MENQIKGKISFWANILSGGYVVYLVAKEFIEMKISVANMVIVAIFLVSAFIYLHEKYKELKALRGTVRQLKDIIERQIPKAIDSGIQAVAKEAVSEILKRKQNG